MKILKEYLIITIGIILCTIALEYFFYPNEIASGGITGLSLVLHNIFNIEPGVVMIISNIVLFAIAFAFIGGNFGVKSIYAAFGLSFLMSLTENILKPTAVTDNLFLATIFGSVLVASGIAIVFGQGASTGGTSITAKLLNKYLNIEIGKGLLICDSIIIIFAFYTFGVERGLFGLISVYLCGTLVDKFIDGFNTCKQVFIITGNDKIVSEYITKEIKRGCTVLEGKGGYTGEGNKVILTIVNRRQFILLKAFLRENDSKAFITVTESMEVLGEGFGKLLEQ